MLKLTRKLEYGLIALRHLRMKRNIISSSKEISQMYMIPREVLAKVLQKMVKLNLGCGNRNFGSDWTHIDGANYPHIDSHNVISLDYRDKSVDLIYASHVIEYFDRREVLSVLKEEGYIRDFQNVKVREGINNIKIDLKYYNGIPVIKKIRRISKPGIRVYSKIKELNKPYGGLGISIISTPKGVMSDQQAKVNNVGGEILCEVF